MLVHVHGQILNVSTMARSLELSTTAVNNYLDILEGALMIHRLPPYYANVKKRLVKHPKLYLRNTGILHRLAGLRSESDLETWIGRGSSFEGLVVEEMMNLASLKLDSPRFSYWRTSAGAEVDLIVEVGRRLIPIEVKHGTTVSQYDLAGLRQCMKDLDLKRGYLVNRSEQSEVIGRGISTLPWQDIVNNRNLPWDF